MSSLNNPVRVETTIGGRQLTIETGRFAKQAHGSVYIKFGDTSALVTAVCDHEAKEDADFFPLTIEFQEKFYSSGKIPGGFFKKEARPSDWATLNARMVDRPIRPLFPDGFRHPTQVVITLLSYDNETEPETIAGLGASCALLLSDAPFTTPITTVRVGRVDGQFVLNPTRSQLEKSDFSVLVSGTQDAVCMVEGGAEHLPEQDMLDGIYFGFEQLQALNKLQLELQKKCGKEKWTFTPAPKNEALYKEVESAVQGDLAKAFAVRVKHERYAALEVVEASISEKMFTKHSTGLDEKAQKALKGQIGAAFGAAKKHFARTFTMKNKARIDGRAFDQIRAIETEISVLPRVHGSALFTRGETQALVTVTLGTSEDEQLIDSVLGKYNKRAMLHYNFPPYSVGETGRFGGNSRREIGHSALAERAVMAIVPEHEKFPYTIRVVSEILESNGSSSMASVCGASMALMDAGVPVEYPVAGIAMGLMNEGGEIAVLSDILGDEDHLGDMDFKICGTEKGVTAIQMDIKMKGISRDIMKTALDQARRGRLHILGEMAKAIKTAKTEISEFAPKMITIMISQERIKDLIGPGGKNIKNIVAVTGVKIDIDDSGKVNLFSSDAAAAQKALEMVKQLTEEAEIGRVYMGTVVRIAEFGAFVNIMPGTDGLVHISELDHTRVNRVEDVVRMGDQVPVKVLEIDRQGKIRLSRKAAIPAGGAGAKPLPPAGAPGGAPGGQARN
jgi:polyribonucleotide nucleotidyltransferase